MSLGDDELLHLAALARLDLDEDEREALRRDLNAVLGYVEQLGELDTDGVEELVRPVATADVVREDEVVTPLARERALALAVEAQEGFFRVPRTVDEST